MCPGHSPGVHPLQSLARTWNHNGRLPKDILLVWCVEVPGRRNVRTNGHAIWERRAHISFDGAVGHTQVGNT